MAAKLARFAKSARKSRVKEVEAVKVHLSSPWASFAAIVLAVLWTIPTFGLFVTSFRPSTEINTSGWWNFIQSPIFTFENYSRVLFEGSGATPPLSQYFLNTFAIVIPSTIIPICSSSRYLRCRSSLYRCRLFHFYNSSQVDYISEQ
jgi:alpha-glucoside transport system permease protein